MVAQNDMDVPSMNPHSVFTRYIPFLLAAILLSSLFLPELYGIPYPQTLGPQFTPQIKRIHIDKISRYQAELVLIGDSVLLLGVDSEQLTQELGKETYSMSEPGSGSAIWYLMLKNMILESLPRPKYVLILFRDTMLTSPTYRTTGRYLALVDDYAKSDEPLVHQLAYINAMTPLDRWTEQYLPLYSARWQIRTELDRSIRYTGPRLLLDCSLKCTDAAMDSVFGAGEVDVAALNRAVEEAEESFYEPAMMDFEGQIDRSFLPAMLQLARENGFTLIFVRTKTLSYPELASEPAGLRRYMEALEAYLKNNGAYYIDFAHDERIKESYFYDLKHLTEEGKAAFTPMLAEKLKPLLDSR
jgi:hypothetical protein